MQLIAVVCQNFWHLSLFSMKSCRAALDFDCRLELLDSTSAKKIHGTLEREKYNSIKWRHNAFWDMVLLYFTMSVHNTAKWLLHTMGMFHDLTSVWLAYPDSLKIILFFPPAAILFCLTCLWLKCFFFRVSLLLLAVETLHHSKLLKWQNQSEEWLSSSGFKLNNFWA